MRTKRVRCKAQLAFIFIAFLLSLSISPASFSQDFTAKTIGDYGNVAVMEVTGNYGAKNPDGSINEIPRQTIAKEFFKTHKDEYDFLIIFSNFNFQMPDAQARAFYLEVKNDIQGIGKQIFDSSSFFGSNGKLQGMIDMGDISKLATDPLDPRFEETLFTLSHELMHRWGAYVRFKNSDGSINTALLGKDKSHWSFLFDSKASVLYGNQWQDDGNGTFTSIDAGKYYSPLDLYLMGFYNKSQVPRMLLIENLNIDPARMPETGVTINGTARYIAIDDIIAAEGARIPGPSDSQKIFKTALILITAPSTFRGDEIHGIDNIRNGWVTRFSVLTDGYGIVDADVTPAEDIPTNPGPPEPPYTPRSIPPNIEDGVKWLMNHQGSDGSWMDMPQTTERDSAETALILKNFDMAKGNYGSGIQWLNAVPSGNMDYLSRKIEVLTQAGQDAKALLDELVSRQNPDGGWGSNANYMSNPTDTSFALKTMAIIGYSDLNIISRTIEYLKSKQNADGGWGNEDEGSSIQSTANVLLSFNKYRDYSLDSQVTRGTAWLMQRQNPDGGFGNSPSTIYDTAIAVLTLREFGASGDTVNNGLNYLLSHQSGDGSWYGSPYQTALAVSAVWRATVDPDLSIMSDDITFTPPSVKNLPSTVLIQAKIWNSGRTDVPQAKVVLYDGMLSEVNKVSEQVQEFPGQSSVKVSFPVTVGDGNEHRFYISVDPENLVKESSETNNIASKILYPEPTYDFEILPSDISVSPNPVGIFSDVKITSRITNKGTMNAYNVQVRYTLDEVGGPIDIATVTVDIPANSSITKGITWRAIRAGENLPITVYVDPFNVLEELSKTNNKAFTYLTVKGSAEPNLTVSYKDIVITPTPAQERGSANLSVLVKNDGFSATSNINVSFYKGVPGKDGVLLGSHIIPSLDAGGSSGTSVNWTNIPDSGERVIYVQVDPGNQVKEIREDDNDAFVTLKILSLPDLTISTNSIVFNPTAPKDGDKVVITVTVHNKGEQDVSNVTVGASEGGTVIGTQVIPHILGSSQFAASFTYDTAGKSGPHKITITVDPDNAIIEQSKDNNQASRAFGVQKADLWLTEPYISPNGDGTRDSTQFFFRLIEPKNVKITVLNGKGETIRTFTGGEFENTTGGNVTWDGLDSNGRVVNDGQYPIKVVDANNNALGSLLVVVDNNRSPLTEAIGTKYLLNLNLTCMLPNLRDWTWLPDESGLLFQISEQNQNAPEYPVGLYTMSPDGGDILRIVPWEWAYGVDPTYDYAILDYALSPNGEKVAFTLQKQNRNVWADGFRQLWVVGRDGKDLALLDSYTKLSYNPSEEYTITDLSVLQWSPDNTYATYSVSVTTYDSRWREKDYLSELWITRPGGTGKTKILSIPGSRRIYDEDIKWSPVGGKIAYLFGALDANGNYVAKLKLSDVSGNGEDIFVLDHPYSPSVEWLNNLKLLVSEEIGELWLVDASGGGNHVRVSDNIEGKISIAPDRQSFAFNTSVGNTESVNVSDNDGKVQLLHEFTITGTCCSFYSTGIIWSPDSRKIAFKERVEDRPESHCSCSEKYGPNFVAIDIRTKEELSFAVSDTSPFVKWMSDGISIIGWNYSSIYVTNSETGQSVSIASDVYWPSVSPSERYITYSQYRDQSSICYGQGYDDLWAMSSLLNLTANLKATKEKASVLLRGSAADLNFEGYKLEYADVKSPEVWNLIAVPSDVPVIDDVFTTWVPPYEGTFYVRLTVWDKAGNVVWDRKRVSWGLSATVTNLYKTLEIFSPNGDGVKDTVELHYRVLEPVHLEFNIYDEKGNLKRTLLKDYSFPAEDYITWDGRDEYGKVVSDGKYQIKVFDCEFFVEVDNTFPEVNIELGSLQIVYVQEEIYEIIAETVGHAFDRHIKNWVIEYGEGDNPQGWYEFLRGVDILVKRDNEGIPILNPVKDTMIERFIDADIEWLVGKKLRITAEDSAGNKSTAVTEFLEEKMILSRWDSQSMLNIIPAHLARPGLHSLSGLETIRLPLVSLNVQYWNGRQWFDAPPSTDPRSGMINLDWDNSALNAEEGYAVRLKAVDILGQEHYSNTLRTMDLFSIYKNEKCELEANNSLFEKLQLMKFRVTTSSVMNDSQWTDYFVLDSQGGDSIPEGGFAPPLPPIQPGMKYLIRMTGIGVSGEEYESGTVDYPSGCEDKTVRIELNVTYDETDCGLTANRASLDAKMKGFVNDISLKALSYYLEKPEGLQLLRQFDLTREEWGSVKVDTLNMPEGNYPVKVILTYIDLSDNTNNETSASSILVVDRVLPAARITYPRKSMMLCPVKVSSQKGDWYGIPVEGIATDNNGINKYELYYGIGESPSGWIPATTWKMDLVSPISGNGPIQGSLGLWDITSLKGKTFSLLLRAVDKAGNVKCDTTSFSFDNLVEIVHLSTDKPLFSPNGDGILDEMEIRYEIDEYATVDMKVFKLIEVGDSSYALDSLPVRTIVSGLQHLGGMENTSWDGKDDPGTVVADGLYGITIFAKDSCGNTNLKWTSVEVDNTPPQTIITYPRPPDPIGIIVEVRGTVDDLNFQNYLLEASKFDQPDTWFPISSNNNPVKDDVLGTWNNSGLDGRWTLRLTAIDKASNKNTATVTIDLGSRKNLIKDLTAIPRLFSPNNDGKLDTAKIDYELTDACDVKIEILDLNGVVNRTYASTVSSAGTYTHTWDGKEDTGFVVSDGPYTLKLTATLSLNPSVTQNETITLIVDSASPIVHIQQPLNNSYVKDPVTVMGTISDRNLLEYFLNYTGEAGTALLDKANQNRENYPFGILHDPAEGSYILHIEARDLGENITRRDVAFTLDRTPPQVTLGTPKEGEYYGYEKNVIPINGAIVEKNLETYSLRYGLGDNPAQWTELMNGNTVPSNPQLLSWKVGKNDGVPDGVYTLSLYVKDKAGSTGEGKIRITIDNTAPEVAIVSPKEGDYVKAPIDIKGTASDQNLEKYSLEISEGLCSSAYKWAPMRMAIDSIKDGLLAAWLALPPDADYCLRLTAVDKIGNKGDAKVYVKVDTYPPAAPVLSGKIENKADARLNWTQNKEPDLWGYNIYRDKQKVNTELIRLSSYLDQNLKEGIYTYTVQAVDFAGNESKPSNEQKIKVDLTAPDGRIRSPQDGSRISGLADIKGTAYSSDDFKQYRVSIGQGSAPSAWNLIRTSPVPISYGTLVQWDTLSLPEGSYSVKLEAEDLSGNTNTHQVVVTVDNNPPEKPELISAIPNNSDATLTWKANTEPDLAGYLLYRNDQLANVSGIVIGNLIPYLVGGTTYVDNALPDGRFKYYLVAMDSAGNMSDLSNTLEVDIDTHEPHATLIEPKDKSKFQNKTLIKAEASDIDIISIQFQYKGPNDSNYLNLGSPVGKPPYITYLDPISLGLAYGDYLLRAVATDLGGRADPSPSLITVTYTEMTPPDAPKDLKAQTNGGDVTLTWAASHGTDLDGYYVYRTLGSAKTKVNTSIIKETTHQDNGLSDGLYTYEITAVDTYGNESEPSNNASAKVYAPLIEQPYTPVGKNVIDIHGSNSATSASVEIFNETTSGSLLAGKVDADVAGSFTLANLNLKLGENRITAKATDSSGNVSRSSEMVVIVYNEPPSSPTGLNSSVENYNVNLTWNPNTEPDLWGYNLYRDGEKMNQPVVVNSGNIMASSSAYGHSPTMAFDSDPSTYWASSYIYETFVPVWLEINLPDPELINHIEIHWGSGIDSQGNEILYSGKDYEIQVWSGYAWISQTKITGNSTKENAFDFNPPYGTDRIRIYIKDTTDPDYSKQVRIAEVRILKDNLIKKTSYSDTDLQDGEYRYRITAVDYYGFESLPSDESKPIVGDVIPPSAPQNLTATASGPDIILDWSPNSETDLAGYDIYRNALQGWGRINSVLVPGFTYTDASLPNGTYTYRVTAVDKVGTESLPSNEASATVYVAPPQPPENLYISSILEGRALRASWDYRGGSIAGYNLYRSTTSGGPYKKVNGSLISSTNYFDQGLANGVAYYYVVAAVDSFGNESAYSNEAMGLPSDHLLSPKPVIFFPTLSGQHVVLYKNKTDLSGNAEPGSMVELFKDQRSIGKTNAIEGDMIQTLSLEDGAYGLSLSPDGKTLAYTWNDSIWSKDLATGNGASIIQRANYPVWSPDGRKLAYASVNSNGNNRIGIYDNETGQSASLANDASPYDEYDPSWSSDGNKIVFTRNNGDSWDAWMKDLISGTLNQVTNKGNVYYSLISPDGKKLAYFEDQGLYVADPISGETIPVDPQTEDYSLDWSPDSLKLAFVSYRNGNADIFVLDVESQGFAQMTHSSLDDTNPIWSPDGRSILFVRLEENISVYVTPSDGQRDERLVQRDPNLYPFSWAKYGGIACFDGNQLKMIYPEGYFSFKDIELSVGENLFYVTSIDSSGNASPSSEEISVVFNKSLTPDLGIEADDIFVYPPSPIEGVDATIDVMVWNKGEVEVRDADVDIYLWDSTGRLELLKSEHIPYMAPASGELIPAAWNTTGKTGTNRVIVVVDPEDRIHELLETNNSATREFFVAKEEGILMTTTLDSSQYHRSQDMNININLRNSSLTRDVTVEVWIEDQNGHEVTSLDPINTNLPYASNKNYSLVWNTGSTYAGSYRVHTILKNEPSLVSERTVPFTILPEIDIVSSVVTDKSNYDPNENVTVSLNVKNQGQNYLIPQINVKVRIVDTENRNLFSEDKEIRDLLPGVTTTLSSTWNTGLHPPGNYQVMVEIYLDGQKISSQIAPFKVNPSAILTGSITATPSVVFLGNSVRADYTIQNNGNTDISDVSVKVLVLDSETQRIVNSHEEMVNLFMNSAQTGQFIFLTEGYGLKTYSIQLESVHQGKQKSMAVTSFMVKDGTPPVISLLSPSSNQCFNSKIDISALATDLASGIDKVEYQVDTVSWRLLPISDPSQGRYSALWNPVLSDEGVRTIRVRATDRAGNISPPVSVVITIDLTAPSPPVILSPQDNSVLSTEMIDIKGVAEAGTTVEMVFGTVLTTAVDSVTGEFVYSGIKLMPGKNLLTFRTSDKAGNVSLPIEYTLYLVKSTIEATMTIPDIKNLVVWVNEECKRDDPIPVQCDDDHKEKCIRLDLLEKILNEATDSYLIVHDREDFEKIKAPYYTDVLVLGDHHFLSEPYRDELRELVYAGKGLISSLYLKREGCHKETDESLFGVEYKGHLPGDEHQIHFMDSPISGEMALEARGKAVRVEVDDPDRVVAWLEESKGPSCGLNCQQYPGVVLNQYGLGKTGFLAFDLGLMLDDENYDQVSRILKNAITYVHKPLDTTAFHPYQMVPIQVEIKSLGSAMDARIIETYPSDIKLYDPMTGKWIIDRPWVKDIRVEPGKTETFFLCALAPDKAGVYILETEIGYLENGAYNSSQSLSKEIVVEEDSVQMVSDIVRVLKSLVVSKKDKSELEDAIGQMEKIQRRGKVAEKDGEKNIDDLLETIESLVSITSTDITEIRLMMDALLEVWIGKLTLYPSS